MNGACDACLRHSGLIALLSPRIAGVLGRPRGRLQGLLALSEGDLIAAIGGADQERAHDFVERFDAADARDANQRAGCDTACRHQGFYPAGLYDLDDPPLVIHFTGGAERLEHFLEEPVVTIVGARRGTRHGQTVCRSIAHELASAGVTVASGLALGIDAEAHRGALQAGGNTIAVMACGPDVAYPRSHRALWEDVRRHGVIVSELPPGTLPLRWSFPARNRIMAAFAALTIVVEAAENSGSLITAEFAADLGRAVAAVPGRVSTRVAAGSNRLLRDGAVPVLSATDVLDDLFGVGVRPRPVATSARLDPQLRAVLDAVEAGEGVEEIGRAAGLPPEQVRAALGRLEVQGYVMRDAFGLYDRTAQP